MIFFSAETKQIVKFVAKTQTIHFYRGHKPLIFVMVSFFAKTLQYIRFLARQKKMPLPPLELMPALFLQLTEFSEVQNTHCSTLIELFQNFYNALDTLLRCLTQYGFSDGNYYSRLFWRIFWNQRCIQKRIRETVALSVRMILAKSLKFSFGLRIRK